jgi:hypothetical protein
MRKLKYIIFGLLLANHLNAQVAPLKLMPTDSMKVFNKNGISIWGNFFNSGNSTNGGSLILEEGANIIMYGDTFKNINASQVLGGGEIIMTRPRPIPYSASGMQIFDGGGIVSSIPDLTVNSPNNVELKINDLKVRDSIKFITGKIILNKHDLILGNTTTAGIITGYDENKYIVTNGNTVDSLKGYFIRENITNNDYVFPVGFSTSDYTPSIINNSGTVDKFKVRVFDTVYEDGYTRNIANSFSISADERSVKRTWDIREGTKGGSNMALTLQYNMPSEGTAFNYNRNYAFVTHFVNYAPNTEGDTISNWKWDNFKRASTGTPISPGTITTGSPIGIAAMKTRSNITSFSPFTITTWEIAASPLPIHFLWFNAQWKNEKPMLNWAVDENLNASKFKVYRSTDGVNFNSIDIVNNNQQSGLQSYNLIDNNYPVNAKILYYKIEAVENNGTSIFTEIRTLTPRIKTSNVLSFFPNPASQSINILINNIEEQTAVKLYDYTGKLVLNQVTENNPIYTLDVNYLAEGSYVLVTENSEGVRSSKLMIIH